MRNLRLLRKNKKLSMKALGDIFGLAESTISLYETGKREPDNVTMLKMADYFGVSVDYLLGRDEQPTVKPPSDIQELYNALISLTNEEIDELTNFVDYIISKRK